MNGLQEEDAALMKHLEPWQEILEDEAADAFLDGLLQAMRALYEVYPPYYKNIEDFRGTYWFASKDGDINRVVRFVNGRMAISHEIPPTANIKVTFKNGKALMKYLLALKKDVLGLILTHGVTVAGNENYLYKFMYLANHPLHVLINLQNKYL